MGAKKQTIGYHYLFSVLFGIGRGPIDELRMIKVGDKIAWEGHACDNAARPINKPDLFGGEKKEGGIQGLFRILQGAPDQIIPPAVSAMIGSSGPVRTGRLPYLKSAVGGRMGELRGRVVFWYDGLVSSMNPYIKEWKFRIRRSKKGWHGGIAWYSEKATIFLADGNIHAMNPAHIIYECCTNPSWGRGLDGTKRMNEQSFIRAANTLCEEGFGLCIVWYRREDIDVFIQQICDHVGATVYTDRETGRITMKLIRDDYDVADLPLFTPDSGLLEIREEDSSSLDSAYNEVIVTGHDPITDQDIQARSHNIAARVAQEGSASLDQAYPGLPTVELCGRVAQRDLRANAAGLRKFSVVLDRRGFKIYPGSVFKISDPKRGIANIVLRAGEIDDGDMINGKITVKAVQDVFGLPDTAFVTPVETSWTPPSTDAVPADGESLFESNYRDLYIRLSAAEANAITTDDAYVGSLAGRPALTSVEYDLITRATGEPDFNTGNINFFTANATLAGPLTATATSFVVNNPEDFPADVVGDSLLVGSEIMKIESWDSITQMFTVKRGAADTWPSAHATGSRVWLPDDDAGTDNRVYAVGETVQAKVLTRTTENVLEEADAALLSITLQGRAFKPYPPADVKVDGDSIYSMIGEYPEPVFTWSERNRLTQADHLLGFFDPTVAPEAGTTYRVRVYDMADVLLRTEDPVVAPWTYTNAMQAADGNPIKVKVELVAVRETEESWSPQRFIVVLKSGWGYNWGMDWGGA